MIVSTKGRYALRVMVELAQHQGDGYVPLNVIAERQDISEKYLESILKVLVQDKLLTGKHRKIIRWVKYSGSPKVPWLP